MFFGPIGKTRWPPWPLIGWDIFDFSSETAERKYTKLDRKKDLNVLYQVCVFRADRKNKMAALASHWLRNFRLLLWNCWTELQRNLTGSKISTSSTKFVFLGGSEKQDGCSGLWLAETFSTSPLKPLNGIIRNLTGSKISTPSTKFVFLGGSEKTRWPPWSLIGWDIFDFSSETVERNSHETWQEARSQPPLPSLCFSGGSEKQDGRPYLWLAETFSTFSLKSLNGIQGNLTRRKISTSSTKFVFFGRIGKTKWPLWPLIGWDIFDFSSETAEQNSTKLWQEERSKRPLPSLCWDLLMLQLLRPNSSNLPCLYSTFHLEYPLVLSRFCFFDRSEKQDGCPGQSV